MENVTTETSNPFGMRVPGDTGTMADGGARPRGAAARPRLAVYGYGDANADFHVVGDHPGRHGGLATGVPFTDSVAGVRVQRLLASVGLSRTRYDDRPSLRNSYLSYLHPARPDWNPEYGVAGADPTPASYADLERFLDAELRAINAHVLLVVGDRPLEYALREHTSQLNDLPADAAKLHAEEVRGRGFLVVPVTEPDRWTPADERALFETLSGLLASDYRQTKGVATTIG